MKKLLLYLVACGIMVPTTLVAAPMAFMGLLVTLAAVSERSATSSIASFSLITFGCFGIVSMWILFFHYRKNSSKPSLSTWHCGALFTGAAVSLTLVASSGGGLLFRALFFGWPLIGAVFFLGMLIASREPRR